MVARIFKRSQHSEGWGGKSRSGQTWPTWCDLGSCSKKQRWPPAPNQNESNFLCAWEVASCSSEFIRRNFKQGLYSFPLPSCGSLVASIFTSWASLISAVVETMLSLVLDASVWAFPLVGISESLHFFSLQAWYSRYSYWLYFRGVQMETKKWTFKDLPQAARLAANSSAGKTASVTPVWAFHHQAQLLMNDKA